LSLNKQQLMLSFSTWSVVCWRRK